MTTLRTFPQPCFPQLFLAVALVFSSHLSRAADYRGTSALLDELSKQSTPPPKPNSTGKPLASEIAEFKEHVFDLAPDKAAQQWLQLVQKFHDTIHLGPLKGTDRPVRSSDLIAALPVPAAWDTLSREIDKTQSSDKPAPFGSTLKLLGHLLIADENQQWNDLHQLELTSPIIAGRSNNSLVSITKALTAQSSDPGRVVAGAEQEIAGLEKGGNGGVLEIPDLVTLAGRDKAQSLLRRALVIPNMYRMEVAGDETKKLAREVSVEVIDHLSRPLWELANSLDATQLYEALDKKFPTPKDGPGDDSYSRREATLYYFLGLIAAHRPDDATRVAILVNQRSAETDGYIYLPWQSIESLDRSGYHQDLFNFLTRLLTDHPGIAMWDTYISIAARLEKSDEALALVRSKVNDQSLPPNVKNDMKGHLSQALLAADQVEEGVANLREIITSEASESDAAFDKLLAITGTDAKEAEKQSSQAERVVGRFGDRAVKLTQIGQLLSKKEWVDEGSAAARKAALQLCHPEFTSGYRRDSLVSKVADLMVELGRGPDGEELFQQDMLTNAKIVPPRQYYSSRTSNKALLGLVALYSQTERWDDIVQLLERAPQWGVSDLVQVAGEAPDSGSWHQVQVPIGVDVAKALAGKGRSAEARKVLDTTMDLKNGSDREYELLLKLGGPDVMERLDLLFRRDQFEERPLIWKAHLLRIAHQLDEAEKTVRAAIAIDPSDGEEGPGDRMRAYAVLADIMADKGDTAQANTLREAVKAIRISEEGDRFYEAGLLTRGVKLYQEALGHFADAYCVQSRLALRLSEMGRNDEAEQHYQRAYELMPDSFGRMESHCFGCEGAFRGKRAQSTAEKVFTALAAKTPDKPQIYYLLGYLREQQERYVEALPYYRKAVALDPDYLNAWKHIHDLRDHIALPISDRDASALNLLRLDPQAKHEDAKLDQVRDLRGLWNGIAAAAKLRPVLPASIYPLPASTAALNQAKAQNERLQNSESVLYYYSESGLRTMAGAFTPGDVVARQKAVAAVAGLLNTSAALSP
jgi:tetratricopeptide (TPR) repeat protein